MDAKQTAHSTAIYVVRLHRPKMCVENSLSNVDMSYQNVKWKT